MVESTFAAQECIRYLKEQRVGTCTFLPLDNIVVKPVSERLRSFGQKYKLCADLVECEDDIFKVILLTLLLTSTLLGLACIAH